MEAATSETLGGITRSFTLNNPYVPERVENQVSLILVINASLVSRASCPNGPTLLASCRTRRLGFQKQVDPGEVELTPLTHQN